MNKGLAMCDINLSKHDFAYLINTTSDMIVCGSLNELRREAGNIDERKFSPM
jgi:hypothetical protein